MLPETNLQLTPEQIAQLEQAKKTIPKVREQLRKAKLAGLDISLQEAQLDKAEADLNRLYRVYVRNITG